MLSVYKVGPLHVLTVVILVFTLYTLDFTSIKTMRLSLFDHSLKNQTLAYDVSTSVCKIPYMDPLYQSVKNLIKPIKTVCWSKKKLVVANDTHLLIQKDAYSQYYVKRIDKVVECYYQSFWRVPPAGDISDRLAKYDEKKHYFKESIKVNEEFVKVTCSSESKQIFMDFFAFVPIKEVNSR